VKRYPERWTFLTISRYPFNNGMLQNLQTVALISIPLVGVWIAWQQMEIARARLRHDLYDRRIKVFEAVRDLLLREILPNAIPSDEGIRHFVRGTADAGFVMSEDIRTYLDDITRKVVRLKTVANRLNEDALRGREDRSNLADEEADLLRWLASQYNVAVEKFRPFLSLRERYWPWERM
jgi:hypothetical protein